MSVFVYCVCREGGGVVDVYSTYNDALRVVKGGKGLWVEEKGVHGMELNPNPLNETLVAEPAYEVEMERGHRSSSRSLSRAPSPVYPSAAQPSTGRAIPPNVSRALSRHPTWPSAADVAPILRHPSPEHSRPEDRQWRETETEAGRERRGQQPTGERAWWQDPFPSQFAAPFVP